LQPGQLHEATQNDVEIPGVTPPGPYYVIVRTDVFNNVPEVDEGDNVGSSATGFDVAAISLCLHPLDEDCTGDTGPIDNGQSKDFMVHRIAAARNVPGLENLRGLDQLPARGAVVIALPMKIEGGSGGPLRAIALVPARRK
jgi:kynurenine formamidase